MCEYQSLKDQAEPILRESRFGGITWLGPVYRTNVFGSPKEVVALWFKWGDRHYMVPFGAPWSKWLRVDVDAQIAEWMKSSPEAVETYLIASPELRLNLKPACECGACKTINANLHSYWCPAYNKEIK